MKIEALPSFSSIHPSQVGMEEDSEVVAQGSYYQNDTLQIPDQEEGTGCCSWLTDTLYCCFIAPLLSCWNCMSSCVSWFFTSNYLTLENFEEIANKLNDSQNEMDERTLLELLDWAFDNPEAFNDVYKKIRNQWSPKSQKFTSNFETLVLWASNFESSAHRVMEEINNTRLEPLLRTALILSNGFSNKHFPEILKPLIPKMKDFIAKNNIGTLVEQYQVVPLYCKHLLRKDPTSFFMQFFKEWLARGSYLVDWVSAIKTQADKQNASSLKDYILEDLNEDHLIAQIFNNSTIIENLSKVNHPNLLENQLSHSEWIKPLSNVVNEISNIFSGEEYQPIFQQILSKIEDEHHRTFAIQFSMAVHFIE
jgi:hypothetical protein